jgi:Na+/H+ antiporter NhaD/arsenite permease-like protein
MTSSVFFTVLVLGGAVLSFLVTPFVGIPVLLFGLTMLFLVPLWAKAKDTAIAQADGGPAGAATTPEASYDPTQQPR